MRGICRYTDIPAQLPSSVRIVILSKSRASLFALLPRRKKRAAELARAMQFNYVCYASEEFCTGTPTHGVCGNAIISRWPFVATWCKATVVPTTHIRAGMNNAIVNKYYS